MSTVYDRTLAALAEVAPPVAAAVEVLGPNRAGDCPVGLLGWLPAEDLLALAKAYVISAPPGDDSYLDDPVELSRYMRDVGAWRRETRRARALDAVVAWSKASGRGFDTLTDVAQVGAGVPLES